MLVAAFAGCGDGRPDRVPVAGVVLIDGKPLQHGFIRLIPKDARPSGGQIGPDGRFQLTCFADETEDGSVEGTHQVTVTGLEVLDSTSQKWHVPKKYADPNTSGLTTTVTSPTDSLRIELSWEGGAPFVEHAEYGE